MKLDVLVWLEAISDLIKHKVSMTSLIKMVDHFVDHRKV